ncbi:protein-glutamate methylesterase/protein-glutamine glutaminase [Alteromonas facilis]|uniref:protein-glutamate methylesterase/protein-glutamine glutaminase n=1 Tax=Alteromonas facilis TaxID=2048004 RepID=UPI000C286A0D|nr:chemotaxis response regulator protein-glutamate methylesterase [Alteromonas facilis]
MKPIRIVIIDDSKLIQSVLQDIFASDPRTEVVGIAENPHDARQVIKDTDPDVITLDVEMPKMNGITFLRNLMRLRPMPVVMISTLTAEGAGVTIEALNIGAIDFIEKPANLAQSINAYRDEICSKVVAAAKVPKLKLLELQQRLQQGASEASARPQQVQQKTKLQSAHIAGHQICAIGGSTGGLEALSNLLTRVKFTGRETIVVCLHLPAGFTASYARRLDSLLPIAVKEAVSGEPLEQGNIYIAPGGRHMEVAKRGSSFCVRLNDNEPVNRHRPSVCVLFDSIAQHVGAGATGIILTGMGRDGAQGLANMKQAGCKTFAQDEATSVVWGMPGAAYEIGAVDAQHVLPLAKLSTCVEQFYQRRH